MNCTYNRRTATGVRRKITKPLECAVKRTLWEFVFDVQQGLVENQIGCCPFTQEYEFQEWGWDTAGTIELRKNG